MVPDNETPAHEEEDGRPDAPRTWTTPELVRLPAGATGNQTISGVPGDGAYYYVVLS